MNNSLYERLKKICRENNITPTVLCTKITGSPGNLATWKKGNIRTDYLIKIADYFGLSIDYLLGRDTDNQPNNIPETTSAQNYIVGYIDFLGTKSEIKNNKSQTVAEYLTSIYNVFKNSIDKLNSMPEIKSEIKSEIKYKIFSDNVLICIPCETNASREKYCEVVFYIVLIIAYAQFNALAINKLFLRGGICEGLLNINDTFVLGEALIHSYKIENNDAKFPRVIIDDNVIKKMGNYKNDLIIADYNDWIGIDYDNKYYINFLKVIDKLCDKSNSVEKEKCIISILGNLQDKFQNLQDYHILSKYKWLYNKIYDFCKTCNMDKIVDEIIPDSLRKKIEIYKYDKPAETIIAYMRLDEIDRAEIKSTIKQMLKADKYSVKTNLSDYAELAAEGGTETRGRKKKKVEILE